MSLKSIVFMGFKLKQGSIGKLSVLQSIIILYTHDVIHYDVYTFYVCTVKTSKHNIMLHTHG